MFTILWVKIFYPCYCFDCGKYWFVTVQEGKEKCTNPKCGSINTNKAKHREKKWLKTKKK